MTSKTLEAQTHVLVSCKVQEDIIARKSNASYLRAATCFLFYPPLTFSLNVKRLLLELGLYFFFSFNSLLSANSFIHSVKDLSIFGVQHSMKQKLYDVYCSNCHPATLT